MAYKELYTTPEYTPIEISTDAEMTAELIASNEGKVYRFTGTTGTYINGDLYRVKQSLLPEGYTQLEYIESTGTQYIDTNQADTGDIKIVADIAFTTVSPENQIWGFGGNGWMGIGTAANSWWECSEFGTITAKTKYHTEYHKQNTNVSRVVNASTLVGTAGYVQSQYTAKLFATQGWEGEASMYYYCSMKMYYCKIYINTALTLDLVPARRDSDSAIGLFDIVNNQWYGNNGSGVFIAGPIVE